MCRIYSVTVNTDDFFLFGVLVKNVKSLSEEINTWESQEEPEK